MIRFEILYDPSDAIPLKLNLPMGTNPVLAVCLMAQLIATISAQGLPGGNGSGLIVPGSKLPKMS